VASEELSTALEAVDKVQEDLHIAPVQVWLSSEQPQIRASCSICKYAAVSVLTQTKSLFQRSSSRCS
jgi:hypothetical protein